MKMKNVFWMSFLLLVAGFAFAADPIQGVGGTLTVAGLQYQPNPAVPGQYIDVWINVQNSKFAAEDVQCRLEPQYPFSIDSNELALRPIGNLVPGQTVVLKYKVRVDTNAVLGDNSLAISCRTSASPWLKAEISISVSTESKSLSVGRISLDREIQPGSNSVLSIELSNAGGSSLRDISVKLDLSDSSVPFIPLEGSTEKRIPIMVGNDKETVQFKIGALASAEPKSYKIPLTITYKDATGASYSLEDTVGVVLSAQPMIDAYVEESSILRDNTGGTILVKIVNRGLSEAKFLNVKILPTGVVSAEPEIFYVGSLDSDDFDTLEYRVFVKGANAKYAVLPLELSFRDANNREYTENSSVSIRLYSEEEIATLGLEPSVGFPWLIVVIVLAGAFLIYKFVWLPRQKK